MKKLLLLLMIASLLLFACKQDKAEGELSDKGEVEVKSEKDEPKDEDSSSSSRDDKPFIEDDSKIEWGGRGALSIPTDDEVKELTSKLAKDGVALKERKFKEISSEAHAKYLDQPLALSDLPASKWAGKKIGVIGSGQGAELYSSMDGTESIVTLPLGTVVEVTGEYKNPEGNEMDGDFYQFNNEYNYWYEVAHEGQKGYIFGSYLVSSYDPTPLRIASSDTAHEPGSPFRSGKVSIEEQILRLAYYYSLKAGSEQFYNFNGMVSLSENMLSCLEKQRFGLESVKYKKDYYLNIQSPDDMIALYKGLHTDRTASTFITMDFLVHNLHLLFGRMMEDTEANKLLPLLARLVKDYYSEIEKFERENGEAGPEVKETIAITKKYFLVAGALLNLNLLSNDELPDDVKRELELIGKAEGFVDNAPIFGYKEDYSQFKPRGHYTKSAALKTYFRTMMWFGRLHFYADPDRTEMEFGNSIRLTRAALLLTKIAKEKRELYRLWQGVFTPITYIVGESDDYTLNDYLRVSDRVDFNNFGTWIADEENIKSFIARANSEIKPPAISGNTLRQGGELGKIPPGGFRLFGQRFTFDSFIHNQLSDPRVAPRTMVKGLDVMAVFGSEEADNLLAEEKEALPQYVENQKMLKGQLAAFKQVDWRKSFYNSYLRIIKESATFDHKSGFYFTIDKLWDRKSLLTAHGAWAELRHDTILYVKQSYAEAAGKGPEKSWVIEKVARPTGYVEPNLQALYWLQSTLADAILILSDNGFMSEAYQFKYKTYKEAVDQLVEIVELQVQDRPISFEQNEFIYSLPGMMGPIILPATATDYMEEKDLQMALVADVHTDAFNGVVLEVATGKPYRIYVALNDGQGGKRIAEGYTYSYYEFTQPMSKRLNDDEWKAQVYSEKGVEDKRAQWIDDLICR